ncbi:Cytochrome c oxidase subunit 6A [Rhodotorula toruloides]
MFAAFRNAGRAAIRARRSYSTAAPGAEDTNAFIASRKAVEEHAKHSADLWRKITYYVAFPAVIVAALNAKSLASEHEAHLEHIKEENGGELPERIVYPYFNKREKDFPWGDNTLFYNPKVNIPVQ